MTHDEILEQLTAHRTLGGSPRAELEWLVAHGEIRLFPAGEILAVKGAAMPQIMIVMLSGHGAVFVDRGAGRRKVMDWGTGDVTGVLPFSRMTSAIGDPIIDRDTVALVLHQDQFPGLIRECPSITATLVHAMVDRVRHFASTDWQDDKLMSMGRLAAGLSHELNNPASAAARSAKQLGEALANADAAGLALAKAGLTDEQRASVEALRDLANDCGPSTATSALDRADREEEICDWLTRRGVDTGVAGSLVDAGITTAMLDSLAATLSSEAVGVALRWIASGHVARALATDVERATTRIHELVSAVKRFTYMDRPTIAEPSSIAGALSDTVAVLAAKANAKSATITLDVPADLPRVNVFGGELNQVWSNLLENALDFVGPSGHVAITARHEDDSVVVRVVDDGVGIPPDHISRIFDPFFTTKPIGHGTGLGLDISRRIVRRHDGHIEVASRPGGGHTEFRVIFPAL